VNNHAQEILESILEEFADAKLTQEELEAKAIFRVLNYCPRPPEPLLSEKESKSKLNTATTPPT